MFINTTVAKKLFKKAYSKARLQVARYEDQLYISGGTWEMEMKYSEAPYKIKAAIVELCGRLPDMEEKFTASKEGLQIELPDVETVRDRYMKATTLLDMTPVVLDYVYTNYKLLQYRETKEFTMINKDLLDLIDIREIDTSREGMPSGPCSTSILWKTPVYWHSELGTLCLYPMYSDKEINQKITEALQTVNFEEGQ